MFPAGFFTRPAWLGPTTTAKHALCGLFLPEQSEFRARDRSRRGYGYRTPWSRATQYHRGRSGGPPTNSEALRWRSLEPAIRTTRPFRVGLRHAGYERSSIFKSEHDRFVVIVRRDWQHFGGSAHYSVRHALRILTAGEKKKKPALLWAPANGRQSSDCVRK